MTRLTIHEKRQLAEQLAREQLTKTGQYKFGIPVSVLNAKANELMRLSDKDLQNKVNEYFHNNGLSAKPKDLWQAMGLNLEQTKKAEAHMKTLQTQMNKKYMQPKKKVAAKKSETKELMPLFLGDVRKETRQFMVSLLKQAYAQKGDEFRNFLLNNRGNFKEGAMELHDLGSMVADGLTELGIVVDRSQTRGEIREGIIDKSAKIEVLEDYVGDEKNFNKMFKEYFNQDFDYEAAYEYLNSCLKFNKAKPQDKLTIAKQSGEKFQKTFDNLTKSQFKTVDDYMGNAENSGGLMDLAFNVGLMYVSGGSSAIAKYAQMSAKGGAEVVEAAITKVAGKKIAQTTAGKAVAQGVGITAAQTTSAAANAVAFQGTKTAELVGETVATGEFNTDKAQQIVESAEGLFKFGYVGGAISGPLGMQVKGLTTKLLNSKPVINQILTKGVTSNPVPLTNVLKNLSERSEAIGEVLKFGTEFSINAGYMAHDEGVSYTDAMKNLAQMDGVSKMVVAMLGGKNMSFLTPDKVQKVKTELGGYKVNVTAYKGQKAYSVVDAKGKETLLSSPEELIMFVMDKGAKAANIEPKVKNKARVGENGGTATKTKVSNAPKVKTPKGLVEKTQTTNPTENVKNKVISEVAKDIKDEGMRLNTPESLDAELAEAEQNPNAPVDNMEAFNLVINGKIGNVLKAQYDNASNVFKDIAKKYSSELDQLEKQYGNDKKLFAEKFTEFLADKLGVKGIEPKIVLRDTGDADGFFDWSTGELAVNSKLNNSKDIQTMIAHEFIHVMQFKDMIANRGAEAVSSLLMHDTKFITAKAIELAKNNGADYKSLPVEEQQIYKEACSEMLADEVMEANKGLVDFAQKNPISKGSLNEYLSRIYQNEYENMKTDVNSPEYYEQVIENEAYYLGNGQLGLNLKGSIHFADTKINTPTKNSSVNVPKGIIQPLDVETAASKIKEYVKDDNNGYSYKAIMQACTVDGKPNAVLLNKTVSLLEKGIDKYDCRGILSIFKPNDSELDVKALEKFDELTSKGIDPKNASVTIRDCKDKNGIFSDDLYNKYTSLKSQDYGRRGVLDVCIVDGEIVETTWQKALELEKLGLENNDIESVLRACHTKSTANGNTKVTGFSEILYSKAKTLIVEQKFKADNAAKIVKACVDKEGKFSQQEFDRAIKYHDKFTEWELPDWIRYSDKALDFAHNLQQKYKVDDWDLTWIIDSWHTKEDGRMFLNDACMAKSEELISKYNVDPRDVSMLINASKTDTEFLFTNYNEVVKLYQAGIKRVDDIMEACTTKIDSENSTVNYDLLHKAAEWQKLGIEENYIIIYAQEINQQKIDVTKNDLVTTYHDAKFEPQNIKALILTSKNLEGITPNEFRDKVLELKKQGYDEGKIINALRQIGASDGWGNPSDKLTKENFDKVVDMFDKGIDDPARIAYMAKENSKLNQEKFNVLYKQAVSGISADRLYYLQNNVEKPEMKDILTDLAKTVNKESNYNDFATLANVMQGRSVDVAKASLDALKNGAKESDILELIKFNPSARGAKLRETIMAKSLEALKEHPEKGEVIREIATNVSRRMGADEAKLQRFDFYLKHVDKYKEIVQSEHPLNSRGQRDYQTSETAIDLMSRLDKAGMPIDDVLKTTDIVCQSGNSLMANKTFSQDVVDKIVELHKNNKLDDNVSTFISTMDDTKNVTGAIDYIVKLKEDKVLDKLNENEIKDLGHTLRYWNKEHGGGLYDNYKEITDFYIKNKDLLKSKVGNIDFSYMVRRYGDNHPETTLNMEVFNSIAKLAEKTDVDPRVLYGLIVHNYADKLPAFVEKIDFEKYPNEAELFLERLSSGYDYQMFSKILNDKITKEDLDFIFDLQKLICENNKNGNPQVLDNKVFELFTEGEKITPEALDKFRYYTEMQLADPKNQSGELDWYDIMKKVDVYKTTPENIDRIENLVYNSKLAKNQTDLLLSRLSKDKEIANKQLDLLEDVMNYADSRLKKSPYITSTITELLKGSQTLSCIEARIEVWNTLKSQLETKSIFAKIKDRVKNIYELNNALWTVKSVNEANKNIIKYAITNDKYRKFIMNHAGQITDKNSALFEDIILNDKVKDGNTLELIRLVCNTANKEVATNFAKENFDKLSLADIVDATRDLRESDVELAKTLYFDKNLNFPKDKIPDILSVTREYNIDLATRLCTDKELNFPAENIADIVKVVNSENIEFATKLCTDNSLDCPKDKIAELITVSKLVTSDIKRLSLSQKINTLSSLTTMDKSMMDLLRRYTSIDIDKKMAELTTALGKKKDIVTIPKAQQKMFLENILANNNKEAENVLKTFDFAKYEKQGIPLKYSREEFTKNIENLVKDLSTEEQAIVLEHFGLIKGEAGFDGLPNNKPLTGENISPQVLEVAQKVQAEVENYTSRNEVNTGDPTADKVFNGLIEGLPEFTSVVGKVQHGTHAYSVDIHTLKVLQSAMNNPIYETLTDKDKTILKFAALCHDFGKKGGVVDQGHAAISAEYISAILEKFPFPQSMKDRMIDIVDNHHWFEAYNTGKATAEDVAVRCRRPQDFAIYEILAKADFENVNKDFHISHSEGVKTQAEFDTFMQKKMEAIDDALNLMYSKANLVFDTQFTGNGNKFPKQTININGEPTELKVLNLSNLKDKDSLEQFGFSTGVTKDSARFTVHMTEPTIGSMQSVITLTQNSLNQSAWSTSLIKTSNNRTYWNKKFGFVLDTDLANISEAYYSNTSSGGHKNLQDFERILFNQTGEERTYVKDNFVKAMSKKGVDLTDKEYAQISKYLLSKKYTTQITKDIKIGDKVIKAKDLVACIEKARDALFEGGNIHSEIVSLNPRVKGLIAKVEKLEDCPEEFLQIAKEYNLPIILMKPEKDSNW